METIRIGVNKSYITGYDIMPLALIPEYKRRITKIVELEVSTKVFEQMCNDAIHNVIAFNRRCAMIMNAK